MMKKAFARVLVALASVVVTLAAADLILSWVNPNRFTPPNVHPFQKPALYRLSKVKELGYEHVPEARVEIEGISYKINKLGYRDIEHRVRKSGRRVVVVGDSVTFGWNLPLEDTYHYQARERLAALGLPIEVLAMGITGYNLVQDYYLIKERALRFDPDLIILQVCLNDFEKTIKIRTDPEQRFMLTQYGEIFVPYMVKKTGLSRWLMAWSYLFKLLNLKLGSRPGAIDDGGRREYYSKGSETAVAYLRRTKALLAGTACRFAAVVFPFRPKDMVRPYTTFYKTILEELRDLSIPTLDLSAALNAAEAAPESMWVDYLHPSRAGNQRAAEALAGFILSILGDKADGPA